MKSTSTTTTLLGPLLLALSIFPALAPLGAGAISPNILVILTDDQGRGDYSAFGTRDLQTPAIDRLFRDGIGFENFRANCPVCSPTRAALLTGRYPDRVGVPGVIRTRADDSWGSLAPEAVLLPQRLRQAGYHTALIGKWHLGLTSPNTPTERGFDYFHGFLGDMMDDYWSHLRHGINYMRRNHDAITPTGHATDLFTDWACAYLKERAASEQPFFLYLAYNAPHDPIQPPPDWLEKVRRREPTLAPIRVRLVALIEHLDAGIGRVLDALDQLGLTEDTLVFFTSDNGGVTGYQANNGPWRSGKQHVYEGGLRVPAAARWPGRIAPGSRTAHPALTMDLFATLCEAASLQPPTGVEAVSFLPALLGNPQPPPERDLYFVRREGGLTYGGKTIDALIRGEWKILQDNPFSPRELYHLASDPYETTNLAGQEPERLKTLDAALRLHIQAGGQVPWQAARP